MPFCLAQTGLISSSSVGHISSLRSVGPLERRCGGIGLIIIIISHSFTVAAGLFLHCQLWLIIVLLSPEEFSDPVDWAQSIRPPHVSIAFLTDESWRESVPLSLARSNQIVRYFSGRVVAAPTLPKQREKSDKTKAHPSACSALARATIISLLKCLALVWLLGVARKCRKTSKRQRRRQHLFCSASQPW